MFVCLFILFFSLSLSFPLALLLTRTFAAVVASVVPRNRPPARFLVCQTFLFFFLLVLVNVHLFVCLFIVLCKHTSILPFGYPFFKKNKCSFVCSLFLSSFSLLFVFSLTLFFSSPLLFFSFSLGVVSHLHFTTFLFTCQVVCLSFLFVPSSFCPPPLFFVDSWQVSFTRGHEQMFVFSSVLWSISIKSCCLISIIFDKSRTAI